MTAIDEYPPSVYDTYEDDRDWGDESRRSIQIDASIRTGNGTFVDVRDIGHNPEIGEELMVYSMTKPASPSPDDEDWEDITGYRFDRTPRIAGSATARVESIDDENEIVFLTLDWAEFDGPRSWKTP